MSQPNNYPEWLNATLASDAAEGKGILPGWISALIQQAVVVGPAFVVLASQDDNLAIRRAMESAPTPGSVLVVAGQNGSRTATNVTGLLTDAVEGVEVDFEAVRRCFKYFEREQLIAPLGLATPKKVAKMCGFFVDD